MNRFVRAAGRALPGSVRAQCREYLLAPLRKPLPLVERPAAELTIDLDMVLAHYHHTHSTIRFLQVGAFDGISNDPIYELIEKYCLEGYLVEPQQDQFLRLCRNYSRFGKRFRCLNAAIADRNGTMPLYRIRADAQGPEWLHQIASFKKDVIMKHARAVPGLEALIEVDQVPSMTFDTLFAHLEIGHIDMLQIDAEGYDAELLKMFDIRRRRPAIIHFEHKHLDKHDYHGILKLLASEEYKIAVGDVDTLAYLKVSQ